MTLTDNFKNRGGGKGEPDKPDDKKDIINYDTAGATRNVCFALQDGKRLFLNYSYLISGEYSPEAGEIILTFTTHTVALKGNNLGGLFEGLMAQVPKEILFTDKRYVEAKGEGETTITSIELK